MKKIDPTGSRFDDFLGEEGLLAEAEAVAIERVLVWQAANGRQDRDLQSPA